MISIKNLYKNYGKQEVLRGVGLEVPKGTVQALLGANGAGKSTLVHILSGLLKAEKGHFEMDGEKVGGKGSRFNEKVGKKVGYVLEEAIYIGKLSAGEYLEFVARLHNLPPTVFKNRIAELLDFMELPSGNKKFIEDYSKGMKAKTSLAAALVHKPSYLVLDEPFNGMDFLSVERVCKLFREMADKGATILVTSHQYDVISSLGDRFALLKGGKIIFNMTMTELEDVSKPFKDSSDPVKTYLQCLMQNGEGDKKLSWL